MKKKRDNNTNKYKSHTGIALFMCRPKVYQSES